MSYNFFRYICLLGAISVLMFSACEQPKPKKVIVKPPASFKSVRNIGYTEVRRYFTNTGLSFNDKGYQLEPDWRLSFVSEDSVNIYNPKRKMFVNSPLILDHDSVFNIAWAYLRLKKASKDSITFQVLRVSGKVINNDESNVYMKLYSNDYITKVLHKQPLQMQAPSRKDTLYIKKLIEQSRKDSTKAFAARIPATFGSKSPLVKVEKFVNDDRSDTNNDGPPIDYLSPEYHISISKAYDDFNYYFTVLVDEQGHLAYNRTMDKLEPEFAKTYPKIMRAIVDGYLKAYLKVTPGTTLGMPHLSEVIVLVRGTKN